MEFLYLQNKYGISRGLGFLYYFYTQWSGDLTENVQKKFNTCGGLRVEEILGKIGSLIQWFTWQYKVHTRFGSHTWNHTE